MFAKFFGKRDSSPPLKKIKFAKLPKDDHLGLSLTDFQKFRKALNNAIIEYNDARKPETKKEALVKMQQAIDYIDFQVPPDTLATAIAFHKVKKDLFLQMRNAYAENGVNTMLRSGRHDFLINRVISDISPDKADRLMEILHQGTSGMSLAKKLQIQNDWENLYDSLDYSPEANQWREFCTKYSLDFLGGSNSRNYKVTNIDPTDPQYGSIYVLKIDNRLGMPRHIEQHLRESMGDVFSSIGADRQVRGRSDEGEIVSRTLLVTDYCTSGSVEDHSKQVRVKGEDETFLGCSNIMGQMTQLFMRIQTEHCCFPDAKLTNWLVEGGQLRLADTKSFVFTQGGVYRKTIPGNENVDIIRTHGFMPTEINSSSFNAENLHASLLGRNIYAYLTGDWPYSITLNAPIFKTEIGKEYKQLIKELIKDPPSSRMSLSDASKKLQELGLYSEPVYKDILRKVGDLSTDLDFEIKPLVVDIIRSDINNVGFDKDATALKINIKLVKVKESADKCDVLMKQISALKIDDQHDMSLAVLQEARRDAIRSATSIDDLKIKLDEFEAKLKEDLVKQTKLKQSSEQCNALMEKINAFKIDNQNIIPLAMLQEARRNAVRGATSIDDLRGKLDRLGASLKADHNKLERLLSENAPRCEQLMQDISNLKLNEKSVIPLLILQDAKHNVIYHVRSVDDFRNKLIGFETKLQEAKVQLPDDIAEYQRLKNILIGLKVGKNDREMARFLDDCDKAIMQGGNLDERRDEIKKQIQKMQRVLPGLTSPENEEIKNLIKKFDARNKWYTIGMDRKARKIEASLADVPIEERARLLSSNHQTVTNVLDAIAWKRKSIFSSAKNNEGKIDIENSADSFKDFKDKFKEAIAKRQDVKLEEIATPKR
ncbi:hypothetical protein [Legionella cincinnatiensis]|uniref:Uncharacterized protein n=1 Tax=Legionella cincinnatiensis TaxID=28085 RepID=A0A378IKE7_9GAMM|nr:hypothetical protein [Legionella cincinnatiensis]KTC83131.1 hypothetical protein Lcin_2503 [Legionella cincinnatiensis]STX35738.1 Uncharacterised protein [Legionella cincinnatiensis]